MATPSLPPIASGFVRKLYSILNGHHAAIIDWNELGTAFTVFDIELLVERVLPLYFRGRLDAFRQQLREHGFQRIASSEFLPAAVETYRHAHFLRGNPTALSSIVRTPLPRKRTRRKKPASALASASVVVKEEQVQAEPGCTVDDELMIKSEPLPVPTTMVGVADDLKYAGNSTNPLFTDDERFDILQWLELPAVDAPPSLSRSFGSVDELDLLLADCEREDAQADVAMEDAGHLTDEQIDVFMRLLAAPSADGDSTLFTRKTAAPPASCVRSPGWDGGNQFSEDTLHSMVEWFSTVPTS